MQISQMQSESGISETNPQKQIHKIHTDNKSLIHVTAIRENFPQTTENTVDFRKITGYNENKHKDTKHRHKKRRRSGGQGCRI